jgi:chemotaxis family two-component system response regulator Rcp1
MAHPNSADILLVEHNPGDVRLITDTLKEIDPNLEIRAVWNGIEAIQFIRRNAPFEDALRPRIVIMDLNLPLKQGQEVLKDIKSDPALARLPMIVLSGSDAPQDINACYALGANCYIVKPRNLDDYTKTLQSLIDFWLRTAQLPIDNNQSGPGAASG